MKAVLMAGGRGTRLYPLTSDFPKPLLPLMGRPLLEHLLEFLKRQGADEVIVTLNYEADQIIGVLSRQRHRGLKLKWVIEDLPLGTAGGVKNVGQLLDETFVVVSGDLVTDADLENAVRFHRKRGALVTILMTEVDDITRYGMILADSDGRIKRFLEKPSRSDPLFSSQANAGIYVLEPEALNWIPNETFFDFSRDLFPILLAQNLPLYACDVRGYWRDLGSLRDYWESHWDSMEGRVRLDCHFQECTGCSQESSAGQTVVADETSEVHETAAVAGPAYIGPGVRIERGAEIGPYAFMGHRSRVLRGTRVIGSILNEEVVVGEESDIRQAVVGRGTRLPHRSHLVGTAIQGYETSDIIDLPTQDPRWRYSPSADRRSSAQRL